MKMKNSDTNTNSILSDCIPLSSFYSSKTLSNP